MLQSTNSLLAGVGMVVALASCTDSGPPCMQDADCFDNNVCHEGSCIDPKNVPSSGSGGSSGASTSAASSSSTAAASSSSATSSSSGTNIDPQTLDKDDDGWIAAADCDDNNPNTFPLKDDQKLLVTKSTTICPGVYKRVRIELVNTSGISLTGNGVTLDADGAAIQNGSTMVGIIRLLNAYGNKIAGFKITNYGDWYVGVHVDESNSNAFQNISILGFFGKVNWTGMNFKNSSSNSVLQAEVVGTHASVYFSQGVGNYVGYSNIVDTDPEGFAATIVSSSAGSTFENNTLQGAGIFSLAPTQKITGNTIKNCIFSGIHFGPDADNNTVSANVIQYNQEGLYLASDANSNKIMNNDLRYNATCYTVSANAIGNTLSGNQCN